jgi:membrane protease YdiL (CAAX protease family)
MKSEASQQSENGAAQPKDDFAAELRGFGPIGIIAIIIILLSGNVMISNIALPFGAVMVLLWVKWSRTPWSAIGYVRQKNWVITALTGIAFGIAFKLTMKALVMPLLGADAINHAYHYLAGNRAILPAAIWAMINAGFSEETMFRGYMFERITKLLGRSIWVKISMLLFTSIWFGLDHYTVQGIGGVEQSTIMGLVFGTVVIMTGRIWVVMIAHAAFDLTALTIVYLNLETTVAHWVFK